MNTLKILMKKFKTHFSSFQAKLLLAFLTATLIPVSVIAMISYQVSYGIAKDKTLNSVLMSDEQLVTQINNRLKQTEDVADTISHHMYSISHTSEDIIHSLETFNSARNNISLYKSTFNFYHIFIFLQDDQTGVHEGLYFFPIDKLADFQITKKSLSDLGAGSMWLSQPKVPLPRILTVEAPSSYSILCFRGLTNQTTGILEYAYCIVLDTEEFSKLLRNSFITEEISSYILTDTGLIAAHSDPDQSGSTLVSEKYDILQENPHSFFHYKNTYYQNITLDNGWQLVTEIPDTYIESNTQILLQTLFLTTAFFIPLTLLVIIMFSRKLTKRITELSQAMAAFRLGNIPSETAIIKLSHPELPEYYDEIDLLGINFEYMQHTIVQNMNSILDLSVKEERLKYQLLQSQINPHFLYNILGSVSTCQSLGKLDIAQQMLGDLTAFYRLTLRKSSELIPIRDELEIARLYLNMEKLCHSDNLDWEIEAEDGVENFMICKFTLQPFLENSILHGLSNTHPKVYIGIHVLYGDETVIVKICDNGSGMPVETLERLRYSMEHRIINYEKHFGISNVNARISNPLYGNGSVTINSHPHEGTCITIEFQQMEESNEKNNDCR